MKTTLVIALLAVLAGCSKAAPPPEPIAPEVAESGGAEGATTSAQGRRRFIECTPESRGAEMCTMDFTPVCGQHTDETKPAQTYSNVCTACKNADVTGYFGGECETGANE